MYIYSMPSHRQAAEHELVHHSNCLQVGEKNNKSTAIQMCMLDIISSFLSTQLFFYVAFCVFQFFCHFNYSRKKRHGKAW